MGDNGRFYLKLVRATLITIVMLGHHGRGTMDMFWGTMDVSMVPRLQIIFFFIIIATHKIKISTFKYYFFIFHFTIKNGLTDIGSSYNMLVDMSIVPHPHVHGVPSSGHHGHLLDFFKIDFQVTSNMNACIVFLSDISLVQCYLLVDNSLMCYKNIWSRSKMKNRCPWCPGLPY